MTVKRCNVADSDAYETWLSTVHFAADCLRMFVFGKAKFWSFLQWFFFFVKIQGDRPCDLSSIAFGSIKIMERTYPNTTVLSTVTSLYWKIGGANILTNFLHLQAAIAQKKNSIFKFLPFMVALHKRLVEIWNKLPKTATEVSGV